LRDSAWQQQKTRASAALGPYGNQLQAAQDTCTRITAAMETLAEERRTADTTILKAHPSESLSASWRTTGAALAVGGLTRPHLITTDGPTSATSSRRSPKR
jgi:hypothetical protein